MGYANKCLMTLVKIQKRKLFVIKKIYIKISICWIHNLKKKKILFELLNNSKNLLASLYLYLLYFNRLTTLLTITNKYVIEN